MLTFDTVRDLSIWSYLSKAPPFFQTTISQHRPAIFGDTVALSLNNFKAAFRSDIIWRTVIFLVAAAVLIVISTRWNRWEGNAEWQSTDHAYLQADLTPISAKRAAYIRP